MSIRSIRFPAQKFELVSSRRSWEAGDHLFGATTRSRWEPDRICRIFHGGVITAMNAIDPRLKAVAPFVGGTGFRHIDLTGIPRSSTRAHFQHLELYKNTIDCSSTWPLVQCPVAFITSSNDFHSTYERIQHAMNLLPHDNWRISANLHKNHGPGPEQWALLNQWFADT